MCSRGGMNDPQPDPLDEALKLAEQLVAKGWRIIATKVQGSVGWVVTFRRPAVRETLPVNLQIDITGERWEVFHGGGGDLAGAIGAAFREVEF